MFLLTTDLFTTESILKLFQCIGVKNFLESLESQKTSKLNRV